MNVPPQTTSLGGLRIIHVYLEYDGPQLFSCVDAAGSRLLALHASFKAGADRWIYVRISNKRLLRAQKGYIPLRQLLTESESGYVYLISYKDEKTALETVPVSCLDENDLPEADQLLARRRPSKELMARAWLSKNPLDQMSLLNRTPNVSPPLWELTPEVIDYFKQARTPVERAATITGRMFADFTFSRGDYRLDIPMRSLGSILVNLQSLIDVLAQGASIASTGRFKQIPKAWAQLDAVASFPSSFGLRFESHSGDVFRDHDGIRAMKGFLSLLEAGGDFSLLRHRSESFSKRAILHYRSFIRSLHHSEADLTTVVGFPDEHSAQGIALERRSIAELNSYFEHNLELGRTIIDFRGRLTAASLRTKYFVLEDDVVVYSGRIANECVDKIDDKRLNRLHDCKIELVTEINELTGMESTYNILLSIEDTDE